jgi:hypothetical protein
VTVEQHNQWKKNWPDYDLNLGYPIADADCVDKGKTPETAINHAYRKLGFLASDWQRALKLSPEEVERRRIDAWLRKNDSTYFNTGLC